MDNAKIEKFKRRLLNLRKDLKNRLEQHRKKLVRLTDRGTGEHVYSDHMADMATLGQEREREVVMMERTWKTLLEVNEALSRIESGTFGLCVSCGKEIEIERLDIIPFTKVCAECSRRTA